MRPAAGPAALQKTARIGLLAVVGLFLSLNAPAALMKSLRRIKQGWELRNETLIESRTRLFGAGYVESVESIRRSILPDGDYLLVIRRGAEEEAALWVRYDLAPRRALLFDQSGAVLIRGQEPRPATVGGLPERAVIVSAGRRAPQLVATALLFRGSPVDAPAQRRDPSPGSKR